MATLPDLPKAAARDALMDAFPDPDELDMMLWGRLDKRLVQITSKNAAYPIICFRVIEKAQAEGWTSELVLAACAERPGNATLAAVAEPLTLVPRLPGTLEQIIDERAGMHDIAPWRAELWRTESRICRIESPLNNTAEARGSGFLIGPDLVLTNWHVVKHLQGTADPTRTQVRFDHKRTADGKQIQVGEAYRLADDWLVAMSPPAASDRHGDGAEPTAAELDFALLRLSDPAGHRPAGPTAPNDRELPPRGWVTFTDPPATLQTADTAIVIQHPGERPMQVAFGAVLAPNSTGTRVNYRTNTGEGSSGSPCFTTGWELAALHQRSGPRNPDDVTPLHNTGIPIAAIVADLKRTGVIREFTATPSGA